MKLILLIALIAGLAPEVEALANYSKNDFVCVGVATDGRISEVGLKWNPYHAGEGIPRNDMWVKAVGSPFLATSLVGVWADYNSEQKIMTYHADNFGSPFSLKVFSERRNEFDRIVSIDAKGNFYDKTAGAHFQFNRQVLNCDHR